MFSCHVFNFYLILCNFLHFGVKKNLQNFFLSKLKEQKNKTAIVDYFYQILKFLLRSGLPLYAISKTNSILFIYSLIALLNKIKPELYKILGFNKNDILFNRFCFSKILVFRIKKSRDFILDSFLLHKNLKTIIQADTKHTFLFTLYTFLHHEKLLIVSDNLKSFKMICYLNKFFKIYFRSR